MIYITSIKEKKNEQNYIGKQKYILFDEKKTSGHKVLNAFIDKCVLSFSIAEAYHPLEGAKE